jgi:hypothetical protein
MKRSIQIVSLIFLTAFSNIIYSQTTDTCRAKRLVISTSIFELLPNSLNSINFNLGTEIYIQNNKSLFANVGVIKSNGPSGGLFEISSLSTQGIKIELEGRHYFNRHKLIQPLILVFWPHIFQYKSQALKNTGYYLGVHSTFQFTSTNRQETVLDYVDNSPFPNSEHDKKHVYTVNRNDCGLHLTVGYQCIKKYGLSVAYEIGLGVQYISSYSVNRLGKDSDYQHQQTEFLLNKRFDSGAGFYPDFVYQVRIGWSMLKVKNAK